MKQVVKVCSFIAVFGMLTACDSKPTGKACLGKSNDSLVEGMQEQCKAGDAIATKHPAYFCDFNYAIAYNDYNSAYCIYVGSQKEERVVPK